MQINNLNCEFYFPTPIWWNDTNYNNNDLLDLFNNLKSNNTAGNNRSNVGGWQSTNLITKNFSAINSFTEWMTSTSDKCLRDLGLNSEKYKFVCQNIWFNENRGKNTNQVHIHGGCFIAGTYYVKVPKKAGQIVFHRNYLEEFIFDPLLAHADEYTHINGLSVKYQPKESKIILFPAWLQHSVEAGQSNESRISLAFNLTIEMKDNK